MAAICLDAVAMKQSLTGKPFCVHRNPHPQISYTDILIEDIYGEYFKNRESMFKWEMAAFALGTDTYYSDPTINVPTVYPGQSPGQGWHSSFDTIENLDEKALEHAAVTTAAYLYYIANAGEKQSMEQAERCFAKGKAEISELSGRFVSEAIAAGGIKKGEREIPEKFEYQAYLAGKRLESVKRISRDSRYIKELCRELSKFVERESDFLRNRIQKVLRKMPVPKKTEKKPPQWLDAAENIIPHRAMMGPIFHRLARMPAGLRKHFLNLGRANKDSIFWVDGKRTLREVIRLWALEKNIAEDSRIIKLYRAYEKAGYIKLEYKVKLCKEDIVTALRKNGIRKGDVILVHSSLTGLGYVEGGAGAVIGALKEAVGKNGTVVMPTFTYSDVSSGQAYDYGKTPSKTGSITNVFWSDKEVLRSKHPSHSLSAWGKYAELVTEEHEKYNPYAREGCFGKLYELDAKILMIGCGLAPNSTLHAVEDWGNHPSMVPEEYLVLDNEGKVVKVRYEKEPQGHRDFYHSGERVTKSEKILRGHGIIKDFKIGIAAVHLMKTRELMDTCLRHFKKNPNFLLCDDPSCKDCSVKKKKALEMKRKG